MSSTTIISIILSSLFFVFWVCVILIGAKRLLRHAHKNDSQVVTVFKILILISYVILFYDLFQIAAIFAAYAWIFFIFLYLSSCSLYVSFTKKRKWLYIPMALLSVIVTMALSGFTFFSTTISDFESSKPTPSYIHVIALIGLILYLTGLALPFIRNRGLTPKSRT